MLGDRAKFWIGPLIYPRQHFAPVYKPNVFRNCFLGAAISLLKTFKKETKNVQLLQKVREPVSGTLLKVGLTDPMLGWRWWQPLTFKIVEVMKMVVRKFNCSSTQGTKVNRCCCRIHFRFHLQNSATEFVNLETSAQLKSSFSLLKTSQYHLEYLKVYYLCQLFTSERACNI